MLAILPLLIFFNIYNVVESNFHDTLLVEKSTLTNAEELKGPNSITECVMRCQRKTKEGFFTNDNICFCHNGVVENQGYTNGILTKEVDFCSEDKCECSYFDIK